MSVFSSNNHFARNPINISLQRSTFDRSHSHKTAFDSGKLIPIYLEEVLPGDTFDVDFSYIIRQQTPLVPVMDTSVLDVYFFFVPNRLVMDDWQKLNGENDEPWAMTEDVSVPVVYDSNITIDISDIQYAEGTLADYFGIPVGKSVLKTAIGGGINSLPFKAYAKIWNDWFRDENLQYAINIDKTSVDLDIRDIIGVRGNTAYLQNVQYGLGVAPVSKLADYFTSCLPAPQKGDPVTIATLDNIPLKIVDGSSSIILPNGGRELKGFDSNHSISGGFWKNTSVAYGYNGVGPGGAGVGYDYMSEGTRGLAFNGITSQFQMTAPPNIPNNGNFNSNQIYRDVSVTITENDLKKITADSSGASTITINDLRYAFALQRFLEKDARGGTRYIEVLRSHFGVISPDARLQRAEYLGGKRQYINIDQVLSTSGAAQEGLPTGFPGNYLGSTGAYSMTTGATKAVTKSFVEHGYIIGVACVRVMHSYSQGLERMWKRTKRLDYYWPTFANIGEQPVLKQELFFDNADVNQNKNTEAFGYNEAWADYRYKLNKVTHIMSPNAGNKWLSWWSYTDNYANAPTLNDQWIRESKNNITQTLIDSTGSLPQFFADFYFKNKATRAMPVYSIPGMIDHN